MLFPQLRIAPATGPVKLHYGGIGQDTRVRVVCRNRIYAQTVDAILVTVERHQAPIASQPNGLHTFQHGIRGETIKRQGIDYHGRIISGPSVRQVHSMTQAQRNTILVTGGAGYIGSHTVQQLRARGDRVVVLDNLVTGFRQSLGDTPLVVGDVGDSALVERLLIEEGVDTVVHFAAHTIVPESVADPLKYYGNNTCQTRSLLAACLKAGVHNVVFSSTAAVYGIPASGLAAEDSPLAPINPYGTSKLMSEWMLRDLSFASPLRHIALRYFNVAGSDPQGRIGQSTRKATLLIKVACEASIGKRSHVSVYGSDYDTPDGTGVRDYIHVADLARAHLNAVDHLRAGGASHVLNCGYGHGYSVREVLRSVERVSGRALTVREEPRRAGDPPSLIASADRIRQVLGWTPQLDDLDGIVTSSLRWEEQLARNPW